MKCPLISHDINAKAVFGISDLETQVRWYTLSIMCSLTHYYSGQDRTDTVSMEWIVLTERERERRSPQRMIGYSNIEIPHNLIAVQEWKINSCKATLITRWTHQVSGRLLIQVDKWLDGAGEPILNDSAAAASYGSNDIAPRAKTLDKEWKNGCDLYSHTLFIFMVFARRFKSGCYSVLLLKSSTRISSLSQVQAIAIKIVTS